MSNFAVSKTARKDMQITGEIRLLTRMLSETDTQSVGFVPTMGALHQGHISLVERARKECKTVVVSIFVNPTQFNDPRDLRSYPRMPEADLEMLRAAGADIVFMPTAEEIYPEPDTRQFDFGDVGAVMEGASRPGHFNGVAQVVSRLFDIVSPARAYFGEKDFQQIAVIKAMVRQLGYKVGIVECPIVREADGLAMSSRNMLLTPEHRAAAPLIYETLRRAADMRGTQTPAQVKEYVINTINNSPYLKVLYFCIVNADTLLDVDTWDDGDIQGCVAVQAGDVRLIDNIRLR